MSASYPASVKSFATRSPGQVIGSAHVNDLQDEVAAIESALVTGPIALPATTIGSLTVSGGSTFTQRPITPPPPSVIASDSTTAMANGSTTAVTWPGHQSAVNSSLHSTAVNSERFTPDSTGFWTLSANLTLATVAGSLASTAVFIAGIEDSSGTIRGRSTMYPPSAVQLSMTVSATRHFDTLSSTQWMRVVASQNFGTTNSMAAASNATFYKL